MSFNKLRIILYILGLFFCFKAYSFFGNVYFVVVAEVCLLGIFLVLVAFLCLVPLLCMCYHCLLCLWLLRRYLPLCNTLIFRLLLECFRFPSVGCRFIGDLFLMYIKSREYSENIKSSSLISGHSS